MVYGLGPTFFVEPITAGYKDNAISLLHIISIYSVDQSCMLRSLDESIYGGGKMNMNV